MLSKFTLTVENPATLRTWETEDPKELLKIVAFLSSSEMSNEDLLSPKEVIDLPDKNGQIEYIFPE